jgi:hypothetical protein
MKIGDVSRHRRFADPVRLRWYAYYRAVRFAQRMSQAGEGAPLALQSLACLAAGPVALGQPHPAFPNN